MQIHDKWWTPVAIGIAVGCGSIILAFPIILLLETSLQISDSGSGELVALIVWVLCAVTIGWIGGVTASVLKRGAAGVDFRFHLRLFGVVCAIPVSILGILLLCRHQLDIGVHDFFLAAVLTLGLLTFLLPSRWKDRKLTEIFGTPRSDGP